MKKDLVNKLQQTKLSLDLISKAVTKNLLLRNKINSLTAEIETTSQTLNKIHSAKFFKVWQLYNKLK